MSKRIISQARGKGSFTYRVRRKAFSHKIKYPIYEGDAKILDIIHSAGHSAPLLKIGMKDLVFYNPAFNSAYVSQEINVGSKEELGNILALKNISVGKKIYNIERNPGDGGKMIRTAGSSAMVTKKLEHNKILVLMPNRKEIQVSGDCRATIGEIAGSGKKQKPFMQAGKKYLHMKARGKLYPRTSAIKMNAVDHPFGSGRGKRIKSKIAVRNAPPGARVGHIRPRRTGRSK